MLCGDMHGRLKYSAFGVGVGHTWSSANGVGLWLMAFNGAAFRSCSNFYLSGFLLLLCEEVGIVHYVTRIDSKNWTMTCFNSGKFLVVLV